jgi:F0F1-type ATP synthase membrane subunit b/b'
VLNIEDSFAKLKFEWDQKSADIAALESQRRASGQRLDDALKKESEAQMALRRVTEQLDQARKELGTAGRTASKILSDANAKRDRILSEAREEAEDFLKNVRSAVAAAAAMIKQHKQENE